MRWLRYLLFLALIFIVSPAYAGDDDSRFDQPEKDNYFEKADSEDVGKILLDLGISFYKKGDYEQARQQFNNLLTIHPDDKTALKYLKLIIKQTGETEENALPPEPVKTKTPAKAQEPTPAQTKEPALTKTSSKLPKIVVLNAQTKKPAFALEIEQKEVVSIKGKTVSRYLLTQPDVIDIDKHDDVLYITGKNIGKAYLYIWDAQQRWTVELKTIPKKQQGFGAEDEDKYAEERAQELQIRYALVTNYNKILYNSLTVSDYRYRTFQHVLESVSPLETPNGDFGFSVAVNSMPEKTEVSYASVRWLNGKIGPLNKINLQAVDFLPDRNDLAFSKGDLRGVQVSGSLAGDKLRPSLFWGEELGLRLGGYLPPGIDYKKQQIFYSGLGLDYRAGEGQVYSLAAYQGGGRDRTPDQNNHAYDLKAFYQIDKLKLFPEIAYDTKNYASRFRLDYSLSLVQFITELRNIAKDYQAVSGKDYQAGQKGVLVDVHYRLFGKLYMSNKLDMFQDGLYPNPDLPDRWNKEISVGALWAPIPSVEALGDYNYRNYLGKNFPTITKGGNAGLRYKFPTELRINLYANYNYNRNEYIKTPVLNYVSNKITAGGLISLTPSVYLFAEREMNRITSLSGSDTAAPKALQAGIDWSAQISGTAFFHTLRFTYRDEQNTDSPFSFLVGEDYIEGYGELSYSPKAPFNFGLSARVKEIRPNNDPSNKRMEIEILGGLSYLFNTHLRIDPVGTIAGYVYEDVNGDGIRQPDEPGMEWVELRIVKRRILRTDKTGAFRFTNVKAKKVYVSINPASIPEGYVLTGPAIREAAIVNNGVTTLNFGVSSRTEIHGTVFEDVDGDYKFGLHDKGVRGVALVLDDGTRLYTDGYGTFGKRLPAGKYRIKIDLATIPEQYLPTVPIFSDFELQEGESLSYNVPLLRIQ